MQDHSDAAETLLWERRVYVCKPVPGESEWMREADRLAAPAPPTPRRARRAAPRRA